MTVLTEGKHDAEFLLSEAPGSRSREEASLTAGQTVEDGQAVKLVASKLVAVSGSRNSDGTSNEAVAGFVIGNHVAGASDKLHVAYIARDAEVKASAVKLHTTVGGSAAAATTAVTAKLVALGLSLR